MGSRAGLGRTRRRKMPACGAALGCAAPGANSMDALEKSLCQEGYAVQGALDGDVCDNLREYVWTAIEEGRKNSRDDLFGKIQEAEFRHDLKLSLCKPVAVALNQFMERCRPLLASATTEDAQVVELASISSDPGALAQPVHADTMHGVTRFLQSDVEGSILNMCAMEEDAEEAA